MGRNRRGAKGGARVRKIAEGTKVKNKSNLEVRM
jgi:hypothetical protein